MKQSRIKKTTTENVKRSLRNIPAECKELIKALKESIKK